MKEARKLKEGEVWVYNPIYYLAVGDDGEKVQGVELAENGLKEKIEIVYKLTKCTIGINLYDKTNLERKEEFENKYSFILAPDEPNSPIRKEFHEDLQALLQQRMDEIGSRVGILRQLLNEDHIDDPKKMIDNEYILSVLNIIKSVDKNKNNEI